MKTLLKKDVATDIKAKDFSLIPPQFLAPKTRNLKGLRTVQGRARK